MSENTLAVKTLAVKEIIERAKENQSNNASVIEELLQQTPAKSN